MRRSLIIYAFHSDVDRVSSADMPDNEELMRIRTLNSRTDVWVTVGRGKDDSMANRP